MTLIDWLVCAVVECAQREAARRLDSQKGNMTFWVARQVWISSDESLAWLLRDCGVDSPRLLLLEDGLSRFRCVSGQAPAVALD